MHPHESSTSLSNLKGLIENPQALNISKNWLYTNDNNDIDSDNTEFSSDTNQTFKVNLSNYFGFFSETEDEDDCIDDCIDEGIDEGYKRWDDEHDETKEFDYVLEVSRWV